MGSQHHGAQPGPCVSAAGGVSACAAAPLTGFTPAAAEAGGGGASNPCAAFFASEPRYRALVGVMTASLPDAARTRCCAGGSAALGCGSCGGCSLIAARSRGATPATAACAVGGGGGGASHAFRGWATGTAAAGGCPGWGGDAVPGASGETKEGRAAWAPVACVRTATAVAGIPSELCGLLLLSRLRSLPARKSANDTRGMSGLGGRSCVEPVDAAAPVKAPLSARLRSVAARLHSPSAGAGWCREAGGGGLRMARNADAAAAPAAFAGAGTRTPATEARPLVTAGSACTLPSVSAWGLLAAGGAPPLARSRAAREPRT
jgi:hypothetical protein